MNKTQLISNISYSTQLPTAMCARVLNAFFDTIQRCLLRGETLSISGFGKFYTLYQNPKICTLPCTKIPFLAPAKYLIKFKTSPLFLQKFKKTS